MRRVILKKLCGAWSDNMSRTLSVAVEVSFRYANGVKQRSPG